MDRPNVTASELQGELASLRRNIHATCLTQMKVADNFLHTESARLYDSTLGGLAQLGERLHGMQEVIGSSPLSSTWKPAQGNPEQAFFVAAANGLRRRLRRDPAGAVGPTLEAVQDAGDGGQVCHVVADRRRLKRKSRVESQRDADEQEQRRRRTRRAHPSAA